MRINVIDFAKRTIQFFYINETGKVLSDDKLFFFQWRKLLPYSTPTAKIRSLPQVLESLCRFSETTGPNPNRNQFFGEENLTSPFNFSSFLDLCPNTWNLSCLIANYAMPSKFSISILSISILVASSASTSFVTFSPSSAKSLCYTIKEI